MSPVRELKSKITNLQLTEKFFIEKAIESLYRGTIDTYRIQVMNQYSILIELLSVIEGFKKGKIKSFITVEAVLKEAEHFLEEDKIYKVLKFNTFNIDYYCSLIKKSSSSKEVVFIKELYNPLKNSIKNILKENTNYLVNLTNVLEKLLENDSITTPQVQPSAANKPDIYKDYYDKINRLTTFLLSGLIHKGYSKSFLVQFFRSVFIYNDKLTFADAFNKVKNLTTLSPKKYNIWFKVKGHKSDVTNLKLFGNCSIVESIDNVPLNSQKKQKFAKTSSGVIGFIKVEREALDHFSALQEAKYLIAENLDILNLGFDSSRIELIDNVLVQDSTYPTGAKLQKVHYMLDGFYKKGEKVFKDMLQSFPQILSATNIKDDSKEKLKSAIRYLRLGNDAIEIEHIFVNYWVGLEYLFSNDRDSSFTRIKEFLTKIQTVIYIKRNLGEYFSNAKEMTHSLPKTHFDVNDFLCLKNEAVFEEIRGLTFNNALSPLLSYRSWHYKKHLFKNKESLRKYIDNHSKKLEQHLIRLYRVRNEIVHEAKFNFISESLTSNLKYYLVITLSLLIDYFQNYKEDDQTSIDDFFTFQSQKLDFWKQQKYDLNIILESSENFELLG